MQNFRLLADLDDKRIIQFLLKDPGAEIYHHPAWIKAISKTFDHEPFYIITEDTNHAITGLHPIIKINSKFLGKRIISLPFSNYCDPLMPGSIIPDMVKFLKEEFKNYNRIELRTISKYYLGQPDFSITSDYVVNILELKDNADILFKSLPLTSIRQRIRNSEKQNLSIKYGKDDFFLKGFFKHFSNLRKRLKLPTLPLVFFQNVLRELAQYNLVLIANVEHQEKVIASGLILKFKKKFYLEYSAAAQNFLRLHPNHKLIWEVIKLAYGENADFLDFGRSALENKSLINFKDQWNTKKIPLYHHFLPGAGSLKQNQSTLRTYLKMINGLLPKKILELEGRIIYRHLD